jgi:hypothetical protein
MRITGLTIADRGIPNRERVYFSLLVPGNLVNYGVFQTVKVNAGQVRALPSLAFWFTDRIAQAGDGVILYTCPGSDLKHLRPDGKANHFFYWGQKKTIFNNADACAVVFQIEDWTTSL